MVILNFKADRMKKLIPLICATLLLCSCTKKAEPVTTVIPTADYTLIGHKGKITFPEMTAEVYYENDSILHWKTTDTAGKTAEGDEKMHYQKLTDNLHFLNWIEKDGFTVSQLIDTQNGTVKAFWSFHDPKSDKARRSSLFVDGKFEFIK